MTLSAETNKQGQTVVKSVIKGIAQTLTSSPSGKFTVSVEKARG